jgi:hypothetical protein
MPQNVDSSQRGRVPVTNVLTIFVLEIDDSQVACRKMWTAANVDEFRDFAGARFRANMRHKLSKVLHMMTLHSNVLGNRLLRTFAPPRLDNLPAAELVVFRDQNGKDFVSYRLSKRKSVYSDFT